jgi:hypothetical protein
MGSGTASKSSARLHPFKVQTSEQLGYGDPSNGEFKSLAVVLCFLRFLLFCPQKATKRTKKKGIGSARLEGPFGHFS